MDVRSLPVPVLHLRAECHYMVAGSLLVRSYVNSRPVVRKLTSSLDAVGAEGFTAVSSRQEPARSWSRRADGRIRLQAWETFAGISGTAAAALTGLLFVAVSIRIAYIARSQELRNRAAQTLSLFGTVLIVSLLIAIPRQAYPTLGAELVVLAVITGAGLYILDLRAKGDRSSQAIAPVLEAVTPTTVTSLLLLAAGIVLAFGVPAGLYVLVVPVLIALVSGIVSTWLLLTKITE
jgi:hypothetical protein